MAKHKKNNHQEAHLEQPSLVLGIDLGGTKILGAVVDEHGRIVGRSKRKTRPERGVDDVIDRVTRTALEAIEDAGLHLSSVEAVGIGAPGVADHKTGVLEFAPNLPDWLNVPLGPRLQEALGVPVFVENDVNAGTFGEAAAGAARGYDSVVGVFPGTGIGGGIVLEGRLWRGARNAAAEIGHMVVMIDGPVCGCGRRGCIEALAARTAIERDIYGEIRGGRQSIVSRLVDLDKERITSGAIAQALDQRDPVIVDVMARAAYHLGVFTASLVNALDPSCVVYGGGLVEAAGAFVLPIVRDTTYRHLIRPVDPEQLPILEAALGDDAVVIGAAMLARATLAERLAG